MVSIYQTLLQSKLDQLKPDLVDEFKRLRIDLADKNRKDAYAFLLFSIMSICDMGLNEAILSSTEGGDDLKIDGFYIDKSRGLQVHIFQSKYRQNSQKYGFGKNEIDSTIFSVEKILQGQTPQTRINPRIKAKIDELQDEIKEFGSIPNINIHFVSNGVLPELDEREEARNFENKNNRNVYFYSAEDIFAKNDAIQRQDHKINITTKGEVLLQDLKNIKSYVATIAASQLLKLYKEAGKDGILEKNIRYFLGNNKINKQIRKTAESEQEASLFWFLNNGISIVCDYIESEGDTAGNEIITLENPTIVNGGQTTKTLYRLDQDSDLFHKTVSDIFLLVRIYQTKNKELIRKITEGTNRQNPIFIRDIKANNKIQKLVKSFFKDKGIFLEIKRNEYQGQHIPYSKIIKNDTVMQAYLSLYENIPHRAKSSKSGVFEEYFDKVFVENPDLPKEFFRSYELLKFAQEEEKKSKLENGNAFLPHSIFAIIFAMKIIDQKIIATDNNQLEYLSTLYNKAIEVIKKSIQDEQNMLEDAYSHNKFFKSSNLIVLIKKHAKKLS